MSIPIDKLYHYIESIAQEIYNDNVVIYRFYPHGSKKLDDLRPVRETDAFKHVFNPHVYCYDQEPLNFNLYINYAHDWPFNPRVPTLAKNLCRWPSVYDNNILLHSEKNSANVQQYKDNGYITSYYWSHAIIALDWFRYARYETPVKLVSKIFLIYNRAWSNTREYRLKFVELLIRYNLIDHCRVTVNPIEPELGIHYNEYKFVNENFKPTLLVEHNILPTSAPSSASADYEIKDYNATEIEVVLETLFDDERIQLTEKILRPIALGQPFLLVSTCGSLEYLRSYGFKTFSSIIDESYDRIKDPVMRLESIVRTMKTISSWTEQERKEKMLIANQLAEYNRKHFFSNKFINQVTDELKDNLKQAFNTLESTNTCSKFLTRRKLNCTNNELKKVILSNISTQETIQLLKKIRKYYNKANN